MAEKLPDTPGEDLIDRRIPVDRLNTTRPGIYYAHQVKVKCTKHGEVWGECVHPSADCKPGDLIVECLTCRLEARQLEDLR